MNSLLRPALTLFTMLTLLTGVAYPLVVTAIGQGLFPAAARGSLVRDAAGGVVGSRLIGQSFADPGHFWSRPSATSPTAHNGGASGGSNLSPTNPALRAAIAARATALRDADPGNEAAIPADLLMASGSGLDPHLSPEAAHYQAGRVARARGLAVDRVHALIDERTEGRTLGLLGEPRVNVLELNRALDRLPR